MATYRIIVGRSRPILRGSHAGERILIFGLIDDDTGEEVDRSFFTLSSLHSFWMENGFGRHNLVCDPETLAEAEAYNRLVSEPERYARFAAFVLDYEPPPGKTEPSVITKEQLREAAQRAVAAVVRSPHPNTAYRKRLRAVERNLLGFGACLALLLGLAVGSTAGLAAGVFVFALALMACGLVVVCVSGLIRLIHWCAR